jgi:tetratricopeptide (TPR) repeat protein
VRTRFVIQLLVLIAMPQVSLCADDKFTAAESKFRLGDYAAAAELATSVIEASDDPFEALRFRSACYEALRMFDKAIDDLDQCIKLKPKWWILHQRRGELHFRNGEIDKSIRDFDHYLSGYPERVPSHWQRGISYYYAAQYAKLSLIHI